MESFKIIRSHRKSVSLEITREGEVLVRAPFFVPESVMYDFVKKKQGWIAKTKETLSTLPPKRVFSPEELKTMRKATKEILSRKVDFWAEKMGVSYGRTTVTSARKRFGSCSAKNDLSFSLFLSLYPEELIDYVVVHELAHTVHHNHSPLFYRFLSSVMPDYKIRETALKKTPLP